MSRGLRGAAVVVAAGAIALGAAGIPTAEIEAEVFAGVNAYRSREGLAPFTRDDAIAALARRHSEAMASGAIPFGHDGMQARFAEIAGQMKVSGFAENVSLQQRAEEEIAQAAIAGWLTSPPHLENIRGEYELSAVAAARSGDGVVYLTQIFVARVGDH